MASGPSTVTIDGTQVRAEPSKIVVTGTATAADLAYMFTGEWTGSDLALSRLILTHPAENCGTGDSGCLGRNIAGRIAAQVITTAFNSTYRGKPLRPTGPKQEHRVDIDNVSVGIAVRITSLSTDGVNIIVSAEASFFR